ncbi:MAG: hypothetical protein E6Q97_26785 [Desulfurellales bacterium]|nr:MAG: hypothetical protein E6Q97_26785 [Desulfurellales bacterium]
MDGVIVNQLSFLGQPIVEVPKRARMEDLNEQLPPTRCSAEVKARLWAIAQRSVAKKLADHIRLAVERYVEEEEKKLGQPPAQPQVSIN